ncbi:hypothetical protein DPMN_062213 [Dreissena polymorpha]|uniref:Uncharacterized protein n=1 Tax=Dreissena polymorpha TaxID=45954 RepID=A0A9D4C8F1_DREPO|nr:hypothetical protein DPMN_062213 [Dreissena polymorpha]
MYRATVLYAISGSTRMYPGGGTVYNQWLYENVPGRHYRVQYVALPECTQVAVLRTISGSIRMHPCGRTVYNQCPYQNVPCGGTVYNQWLFQNVPRWQYCVQSVAPSECTQAAVLCTISGSIRMYPGGGTLYNHSSRMHPGGDTVYNQWLYQNVPDRRYCVLGLYHITAKCKIASLKVNIYVMSQIKRK